MDRRKYFIIGVILMTILGAVDLITTRILTPDLKNEGNAFITEYGFGWVEIILVSIALICFVTIPFYYHCLVFNLPADPHKNNSTIKFSAAYFLHNDKKPIISIGKALFSVLGFFLFWWYTINKITAIIHNLLCIAGGNFSKVPFSRRMDILDSITNVSLIIVMLIFLAGIVYKSKNIGKQRHNTSSIHFSFVIAFFLLYLSF